VGEGGKVQRFWGAGPGDAKHKKTSKSGSFFGQRVEPADQGDVIEGGAVFEKGDAHTRVIRGLLFIEDERVLIRAGSWVRQRCGEKKK